MPFLPISILSAFLTVETSSTLQYNKGELAVSPHSNFRGNDLFLSI